ncbi:regulator of nonsense transcripts UPF3-like isoform X2 [Magnolia sinica]|uniref:regulator of nonsense transcripts UPF3-like isoform X2 n=1 Tax=Magnolia sinica TaxID=86752 RepID=UPI00265941B6|nr:regulator of nonsense transcripts UPF3-like isoform X2 [Magnolia sinica]
MKDPFGRTKLVLRHLPPSISQSALTGQIDSRFAGRYKWFFFRPGKNSQKNQRYSRAYIDFQRLEDVVEFAEFFDGHVFVNEKGSQYTTIVEYAPSQRVPKPWAKKDGREGTIFKDPEYLEFLDLLAKPVENLPSAEIQLERREAERAGAPKETVVVTPLMDFVRQKRAAKSGSQRPSANGKLSRRAGGAAGNSSSASTRRSSEKRRVSTSVYVLRDSSIKNASSKEKPTYLLVPRRDEQQVSDKSTSLAAATETETLEDETVPVTDGTTSGTSGSIETGKRKVILLKGKVREVSHNQRREASGRIIRSILSNKEARQNQSPMALVHSEQHSQTLNLEKEKRPPRPTYTRSVLKDHISSIAGLPDCEAQRGVVDDKFVSNDLHTSISTTDKQDRRTRNKDRPDRGVWTLRRSDGLHTSDESLSSSSLPAQLLADSLEGMSVSQHVASGISKHGDIVAETESSNNSSSVGGRPWSLDVGFNSSRLGRGSNSQFSYDLPSSHGETKVDGVGRSADIKNIGSGRSIISSMENGSHRHGGRRGSAHGLKEVDNLSEGKLSKRGGAIGYGSYEKQVWVQKSGSGS